MFCICYKICQIPKGEGWLTTFGGISLKMWTGKLLAPRWSFKTYDLASPLTVLAQVACDCCVLDCACVPTSAWWSGWCSVSGRCSTWPALREERLHRGSRVWEGRPLPGFPGTPARTEPRPPARSKASASRPSAAGQPDVTAARGLGNFNPSGQLLSVCVVTVMCKG